MENIQYEEWVPTRMESKCLVTTAVNVFKVWTYIGCEMVPGYHKCRHQLVFHCVSSSISV